MASWDRPAGLIRVDLGVDSYPDLRERLEWKVLGSALLRNYEIGNVSLFVPSETKAEDIGTLGHGGFTHLCDTIVPLRDLSSEFLHADDTHCLVFESPFASPGDNFLKRASYQYFCYENAVFRFVDAKYQSVPCELDDILDDLGVYSALAVLTKASGLQEFAFRTLPEPKFQEIVRKAKYAFVEAHDGEASLVWRLAGS